MEKQQFLDKFEELKSPANAERWAVLQLWLVEAKSDGEIAKALDKDRSTATRKIGEICKHFGTDAKGKKEHRQHLVLLFRRHCKDFEVHPSIYPDWVDGDLSDRPQPPTNPQNIPTPEPIPELTTLEFIGRDRDLTNLANLSRQAKIVLIKAGAGVGKSTLAREFLQTQFKKVIRIEMGLESGNVTPAEEKVSQILRKDFDEEPSRDFMINLDILREKLADRENSIGVLIDNLEPALDENYRFREKLRGYDALLAVLGDRDVYSFTLITSRRSLIATRAKVHEYSLEGLDITAWRQYFHDCENGADSEALMQMCVAYNGNAKVMDILHGAINNRFDGNIGAYWNRYKDALLADSELETLISVEMDWLRDNQPDAYKLLCRMGCYRYQDVKTVPFEGLICLLWDVPESQQVGVVDFLSKSSLIEVKGEYYLHPAVRESSKSRLMENPEEWQSSNRKAAEYWSKSVNQIVAIEDALQALESYYQYFSIQDFEQAGSIILIARGRVDDDSLDFNLDYLLTSSLGSSFIRLGLYQPIIRAISQIIKVIDSKYILCKLHNLLGDLMGFQGNIRNAIYYHQKSGEYAKELFNSEVINFASREVIFKTKVFSIVYLFNIGICMADLWEIEKAISYLEQACSLSKENMLHAYEIRGWSNLASIYSSTGNTDKARFLAQLIAQELTTVRLGVRSTGYRFYHLAKTYQNLGDFELSLSMYTNAYKYAEQTNFNQLLGIVHFGLANVYKQLTDYAKAIEYHKRSILILKKINDVPSLAEASFLFGLTYQAMGEHDQAEEYKAKALELFAQMEAPKQIERVKNTFGGNIQ